MKIRTKVLSLLSGALVIQVLLVCVVLFVSLSGFFEEEQANYQKEEMQKVQQNLKNYVEIAYEALRQGHENATSESYIKNRYGPELRGVIETIEAVIQHNMDLVAQEELTLREAKENSKQFIKKYRYDNGTGYVWINDMGIPFPKMIMHPTAPALDGKVLDDPKYNVAGNDRENLFTAMVKVCAENGEGFVGYVWPKPTKEGLTEEQPKLSFVKHIKEWDWVIGTGVYVDDAVTEALEQAKKEIGYMRYDRGKGYFWIQDDSRPYPTMVMHPLSPQLNGQVMDGAKWNVAKGGEKHLFKAIVNATSQYGEGFVDYEWDKPSADGTKKKAPKLSFVKAYRPLGWIIGTGVYVDDIDARIAKMQEEGSAQMNSLLWGTLGSAVLCLIVVMLVAYPIVASVVNPIKRMAATLQDIAQGEGDLRQRIDADSKDELGEMAQWFNVFVEKIEATVRDTAQLTAQVVGYAQQLTMTSQSLESNADGTSAQSAAAASAGEEISMNMSTLSSSVEEMSASINEIARGTTTSAEVAAEAVTLVRDTEGTMQELDKNSEEIDSIVKTIVAIAEQTNLLALNATIEAARAGDAGKGFAVVASEVKDLARETAKSTDTIHTMIESIQGASRGAVSAIASIRETIDKVSELTNTISSAVQEQTATTGEMSRSVHEVAEGAKNIAESITSVAALADGTSSDSHTVQTAAAELSNLSQQLFATVNQFKFNE